MGSAPQYPSNAAAPSGKYVPVVSGQDMPICRSLLVGTAGTATLVDVDGTTRTDVPLQQGYNPLRASKVTLTTAANVWALY